MTVSRRDFLKISSAFGVLMLAPKEADALFGASRGVVVTAHTQEGESFPMRMVREIQDGRKFTFKACMATGIVGTFDRFTLELCGRQVGDRQIEPIRKNNTNTMTLTWDFTIEEGNPDRWRSGGYIWDQRRLR